MCSLDQSTVGLAPRCFLRAERSLLWGARCFQRHVSCEWGQTSTSYKPNDNVPEQVVEKLCLHVEVPIRCKTREPSFRGTTVLQGTRRGERAARGPL